ncbi:MAG: hypothetical protein ABI083_13880 [Lapillicoccus sp.]
MPAVVRRTIDAPLSRVWETVTDFAGYGRWIPLTTMAVDPMPPRVGWGFVGRTGLGPVGFRDSMLVTVWEPPDATDPHESREPSEPSEPFVRPEPAQARFCVRKTGRLLAGWAEVVAVARDDGRTDLTWTEEIVPRPEPIGRLLQPLSDPVTSRLFARAVAGMAAAAEAMR